MIWSTPMYTKSTRIDAKVVVITGANTGIGKETARDMYRRGGSIILAVRDVAKGYSARDDIVKIGGGGGIGGRCGEYVEVMHLDLQCLKSVRRFARDLAERTDRVDILVNNAGVMACPQRGETRDGFELQLGVNHLGHFLLTALLLPLIKTAAAAAVAKEKAAYSSGSSGSGSGSVVTGARIINLTSAAHTFGQVDFDDLMLTRPGHYSAWGAYGQSKLANILFTRELSRRLAQHRIAVYAVHPGMVNTALWRHLSWPQYLAIKVQLLLWYKTSVQGAQTTLYCALDPDLAVASGGYYADCAELAPSQAAQNDNDASRLWRESCQLVGITEKWHV